MDVSNAKFMIGGKSYPITGSEIVYSNDKKECNRCGVVKLDKEFPKLDNTCKKCRYEIHKQYQIEQRETLGDWYVKEYGKYTYGYSEFTEKLIDELRSELKEKRKPTQIYTKHKNTNSKQNHYN